MNGIAKGFLLTVLSMTGVAHAQSLLDCEFKSSRSWTACSIDSDALAPKPVYQGEGFEADFTVSYSFICGGGTPTEFVFEAGGSRRDSVVLEMGANQRMVTVTGDQELVLSSDLNRRKTFAPGCSIEVHSVSYLPTIDQIDDWNSSSITQARLIDKGIDLYLLSSDLENFISWDSTTTNTLLEAVNRKITAFEGACEGGDRSSCRAKAHFIAVRNSLQAKIEGTPIPSLGSGDMSEVKALYLEELQRDVAVGNAMVDRYEYWQLEVEKSLKEILDQIPDEA